MSVRFIVAGACLLWSNVTASSYPESFLSAKLGASIATDSRLSGKSKADDLLSDGPVSKGRIGFAGLPQWRRITIDLGSVRTCDRVEIGVGGVDCALTLAVSRERAEGPYTNVLVRGGLGAFQVQRLPERSPRAPG